MLRILFFGSDNNISFSESVAPYFFDLINHSYFSYYFHFYILILKFIPIYTSHSKTVQFLITSDLPKVISRLPKPALWLNILWLFGRFYQYRPSLKQLLPQKCCLQK